MAAPMIIPMIKPAIETNVATRPSLFPLDQETPPKTIPKIPNNGGTIRKAMIPQTSPAIANPCAGFDGGGD